MNRVTATVRRGNRTAKHGELDEWKRSASPWTVTLRYQRRRITVEYWTGAAISEEPTAAGVLECILSDAYGAEQSFEDWCGEYGYDSDSRKAEKLYNVVQQQTRKLRQLLGADFESFLGLEDSELERRCA